MYIPEKIYITSIREKNISGVGVSWLSHTNSPDGKPYLQYNISQYNITFSQRALSDFVGFPRHI